MYVVERIPRLQGIQRSICDIAGMSRETQWVIFDVKRLQMRSIKMSIIEFSIMLANEKLKTSLAFSYFNGYLRLVSKGVTSPSGDPYAIDVGDEYNYYDIHEELHTALVKFSEENKDFIVEYHATSIV